MLTRTVLAGNCQTERGGKKIQQSGGQIFSKEEVGRKTLLYKKRSTNKVEKLAFVLPFSP